MAKYDNSAHWEEYRKNHLFLFLKEFESEFNLKDKTIDTLIDECLVVDYKEMQSIIRRVSDTRVPLTKLRTRFRSYAYKHRNNLSSISITSEVKGLLDEKIKELSFSDYSDLIKLMLNKHHWQYE
jgi:flagellar biosynthesis component FlhA